MSSTVRFSPIGSKDAKRIQRLQRQLFAPELRESLQEIREILLNTEKFMVCNLSFGLFDNTDMVGYVFAYVETESLFYQRQEEVIYVKEIALLPEYERYFRRLLFKLYGQWSAFTPNMPLEAHALADALGKWQQLIRFFRYFGVTLTATAEDRQEGRPPYQLLRFDVSDTTADIAEQVTALPKKRWHFRDDISVSLITDSRQWLSLKPHWNDLLRLTSDYNVFQSFEYLWEWWKYFGIWNDLWVMVIRRGETIIGVVPLMRECFPIFGKTVRNLMFMTVPMEMSRPKLIFGRDSATCLPAFLAYLEAHADSWDILDIDEQLQTKATDSVRQHFRDLGYLMAESETLCPYIELDGTWDHFLMGRSKRMRSNVKRLRRRLASLGETGIRRVTSWPELDAAMDTHCEIEERSWKSSTNLDLSSNKSHYFFYRSLARVFGQDGKFELRVLECGGQPLASTFGIVYDNLFQSLKIAHVSEYDKFSPGTLLESYELEELFGGNLSSYEFLGSFLTNKLRWTSTVHRTINLQIYRRQPRLAFFFFFYLVFKRRVKVILKRTGQFDRVHRFLKKFPNNLFLRH
jgi:CelD/BcsL family acetyltransferase involved in cellulose biosynthesis